MRNPPPACTPASRSPPCSRTRRSSRTRRRDTAGSLRRPAGASRPRSPAPRSWHNTFGMLGQRVECRFAQPLDLAPADVGLGQVIEHEALRREIARRTARPPPAVARVDQDVVGQPEIARAATTPRQNDGRSRNRRQARSARCGGCPTSCGLVGERLELLANVARLQVDPADDAGDEGVLFRQLQQPARLLERLPACTATHAVDAGGLRAISARRSAGRKSRRSADHASHRSSRTRRRRSARSADGAVDDHQRFGHGGAARLRSTGSTPPRRPSSCIASSIGETSAASSPATTRCRFDIGPSKASVNHEPRSGTGSTGRRAPPPAVGPAVRIVQIHAHRQHGGAFETLDLEHRRTVARVVIVRVVERERAAEAVAVVENDRAARVGELSERRDVRTDLAVDATRLTRDRPDRVEVVNRMVENLQPRTPSPGTSRGATAA